MKSLNDEQIAQLLKPIKSSRVLQANGQSHVPAYDVAAHLTRILGFGNWDKEILDLHLVREFPTTTSKGVPAWEVTYACSLRLTIKNEVGEVVAQWDDASCGTSLQPQYGEAHDMAMKSAVSYALKRCAAFGLGDQFGLSLYNKGNTSALIGKTLISPIELSSSADLEAHIPKPESLGNDERQETGEIASEAPRKPVQPSKQNPGPTPLVSPLQAQIREHKAYVSMDSAKKGEFLADTLGFPVTSIRDLSDDDCEQVLAKLRSL